MILTSEYLVTKNESFRLKTRLIRCVTLDFRAASLACKVLNFHTEGGCDGLETWVEMPRLFYHFSSEMCRQAGFFSGGETDSLRSVYFAKFILALT
jgi:hypothetical protein